MTKLEELLTPYLKNKKKASEIAEELSAKGVVVAQPYGTITCKFGPGQALGSLTINGEEIEVYLASCTTETICYSRPPMTCRVINQPMRLVRRFTMIEI